MLEMKGEEHSKGWIVWCEMRGVFDSELRTLRIECESFYIVWGVPLDRQYSSMSSGAFSMSYLSTQLSSDAL
jgi:hypothetical protein